MPSLRTPQDSSVRKEKSVLKEAALLLLCLPVLAAAFAAYWFYPFPGDTGPSIWGFIALCFREAFLLAFFGAIGLIVVVLSAVAAIAKAVLRLLGRTEVLK